MSLAAGEAELVIAKCFGKKAEKLASEHLAKNRDGEKKPAAGPDPSLAVRREAAGGNQTVQMRMEQKPPTIP